MLEELPAGVAVDAAAIADRIYAGAHAHLDPEDLWLLERCAEKMPAEAYQYAAKHPLNATRPRLRGLANADALSGLQAELRATYLWHAALPRQVILWRGERANDDVPGFVEQMLTSAPGDLIERGSYVLSCTVDPAVAANGEFTAGKLLDADRSDSDGWVLRIRTDHALYIGSRDHLLADPDGVVDEREVLLFARTLQVLEHREMLVDGARGLQRVHVIDCTAPPLIEATGSD